MANIIKLSDALVEEYRDAFEKALKMSRSVDGKFSFARAFEPFNEKATVYFTPKAWVKMLVLIDGFEKEVAWHGVAKRINEDEPGSNEYEVSDILVYPQKVTGASVDMDQEKYASWLDELDEAGDDRIFDLKMQGHSHVRMGVTPSGVDIGHQKEIVEQLSDDGFYIFMIFNKSLQRNVRIFDLRKNIMFDTKDVDIVVREDGDDIRDFLSGAKKLVQNDTYYYKQSYYGNQAAGGAASATAKTPSAASASSSPASPSPSSGAANGTAAKTSVPISERPKAQIGAGWRGSENDAETDPWNMSDQEWYDRYVRQNHNL